MARPKKVDKLKCELPVIKPVVKYSLEQLAFSKYVKGIEDNWYVNPRFEREFVSFMQSIGVNPVKY